MLFSLPAWPSKWQAAGIENKTRPVFLSDFVCSSPDKFLKGGIFNQFNTFTRNGANSNIELARAKSEALVNILINKNRVMLNGYSNENGIEINRSNRQKAKFARAAHFFVHFFAVVLHDYTDAVLHD